MTAVEKKKVIICIPGVLAHCEQFASPLHLEDVAEKVIYLDYDSKSFKPGYEIGYIVEIVEAWRNDGYDVELFGWSLGGNISLFVIERLLQCHRDLDSWFSAVVLDSPAGLPTLKQIPNWLPEKLIVSPVGTVLFMLIGWGILLVNRMGIGLPKDEFISRPDPHAMKRIAGRNNFSDKEWRAWVKQEFKNGLRGHHAKLWRQQVQWMVKIAMDGSFERAILACIGQNIRYVACMAGNDVIEQPLAAQRWAKAIIGIWTVEATHAGFLQKQPQFKRVLTALMQ